MRNGDDSPGPTSSSTHAPVRDSRGLVGAVGLKADQLARSLIPDDLAPLSVAGADGLLFAVGDPSLGEALVELDRTIKVLQAAQAALSAALEDTPMIWAPDGARSGADWLACRTSSSRFERTKAARLGRVMRQTPRISAALLKGFGSMEHLRLIQMAASSGPHRERALHKLDETASDHLGLSTKWFSLLVNHWAALADAEEDARRNGSGDPDDPDPGPQPLSRPESAARKNRAVTLSPVGPDGTWALNGTLTPEVGAMLAAALDSVMNILRQQDDPRTRPQLRHDALEVILNGTLSAGLPHHRGVRPHILVTATLDDLTRVTGTCAGSHRGSAPGAQAGCSTGGPSGSPPGSRAGSPPGSPPGSSSPDPAADRPWLPIATGLGSVIAGGIFLRGDDRPGGRVDPTPQGSADLARLLCDATIELLMHDEHNRPLALGRTHRTAPSHLRRAIDHRDGGCRFAGCTTPNNWAEAHHIVEWEKGGLTEPENLVLICHFHHRAIHNQGFTVNWNDDRTGFVTRRPDGSVVQVKERRR